MRHVDQVHDRAVSVFLVNYFLRWPWTYYCYGARTSGRGRDLSMPASMSYLVGLRVSAIEPACA